MAPSLEAYDEQEALPIITKSVPQKTNSLSYTPGRSIVKDHSISYKHSDLLPSFPDKHWEPLTPVPYTDKAHKGLPTFHNLLSQATSIRDITPKIGTVIHGVSLASLSDSAKDDLALLISQRGVVFFPAQHDLDIDSQRAFGRYYGELHKHATTSVPARGDIDDVHVVYTDEKSKDQRALFSSNFLWHSDVTYEEQPPSYTALKVVTGPPTGGGGDTLWVSGYAAYDALSRPLQIYLESLTALHSSHMQAEGSRAAGRPVRRAPIVTEHPLVRSHPVTGWKSLFYNPGFVTGIVGVPKAESDAILALLNETFAGLREAQARWSWSEGDVAVWDNRVTVSFVTAASRQGGH